jgi:hypothetical protein
VLVKNKNAFNEAAFLAALIQHSELVRMSPGEIGRAAGVEPSIVVKLMRGTEGRKPSIEHFCALVRWMGADANEFITKLE